MAISPAQQEKLAESVRLVYAQLEQQILEDIAKRVNKIDKNNWRYNQLEEIRAARAEVEDALNQLGGKLPDHIRDVILQSYDAGIKSADEDLAKYQGTTVSYSKAVEGFGKVHQRAVEALVAERIQLFNAAHVQILRSADDAFREIIGHTAMGTLTGTETRRQSTQRALNRFADKGIGAFTDKAGRTWNLSSYAEMATRTAVGNAAIEGHLNRMTERGRDLVIVSDHAEECDRCRPWEGKVLSVSGDTRGYPTVSDARAGGLFHPNCGHTVHAYLPGFTTIPKGTADPTGDKLRQKQRYLERQIRHWKKREAVAIDPDAKAKAAAKVKEWQKATREFVAKHDRLRQNHREQLRIGKKGVEKDFGDLPFIKKGPKKPPPNPPAGTAAVKPKPAPKPAPPPKTFGQTVQEHIKQNPVKTEVDARNLGNMVRKEVDNRVGPQMKKKAKLQAEVDHISGQVKAMEDKYWKLKDKTMYMDWSTPEYEKVRDEILALGKQISQLSDKRHELTQEIKKFKGIRGDIAKEVLSEIRPFGSKTPQPWAPRSNSEVKDALEMVRKYFPSDWLHESDKTVMLAKKVQRGYYRQAWRGDPADYALSGRSAQAMRRVAIHEMGHRFENVVPGIMRLEYEFYKRRTAGESLQWLGNGYAKTEKTRFDNFLEPYMGKDYGNSPTSYFELLSMGLESLFADSYDLDKDIDYYEFILGLLAGV